MRQAGGRLSASLLLRQKCDGAATSRRPVAPERRCPETCPVPPGPRHLRSRLVRRLPGGWPAVAGSTAVATFLSLEGRLRQDAAARSLTAGDGDTGTTRAIGATFPVALLGHPLPGAPPRPPVAAPAPAPPLARRHWLERGRTRRWRHRAPAWIRGGAGR